MRRQIVATRRGDGTGGPDAEFALDRGEPRKDFSTAGRCKAVDHLALRLEAERARTLSCCRHPPIGHQPLSLRHTRPLYSPAKRLMRSCVQTESMLTLGGRQSTRFVGCL